MEVSISSKDSDLEYKYAIYDKKAKKIVEWEGGENRKVRIEKNAGDQIVHDEHFQYTDNWKGAGVAIPVFSLRTKDGLGVG